MKSNDLLHAHLHTNEDFGKLLW